MISRRLKVRSPIREIVPSFCLPPVDICLGTSPSHAAKSRPLAKVSAGGAIAAMVEIGQHVDHHREHRPCRFRQRVTDLAILKQIGQHPQVRRSLGRDPAIFGEVTSDSIGDRVRCFTARSRVRKTSAAAC